MTLRLSSRLENLAFAGATCRAAAADALGSDNAALVELAITEVCSNIVRYAHPTEPDHVFTVSLSCARGAVVVRICDAGPAFTFDARPMPAVDGPLDDLPEAGFGVALVHRTMDAVAFVRMDGVNTITLTKRASTAPHLTV